MISDHRNVYIWFVVRTTIAHEVGCCQVHDLADSILDSRLSLLRSGVFVEIDKLMYWTIGSRCLFFGASWIHDHESLFPTIVSELEVGLELLSCHFTECMSGALVVNPIIYREKCCAFHNIIHAPSVDIVVVEMYL